MSVCVMPYGKPELVADGGIESLRFNVSHSQGLALYAFTLDRKIGIDLEYVRHDIAVDDIAGQFFSPLGKTAFLKTLSGDVREKNIFYVLDTERGLAEGPWHRACGRSWCYASNGQRCSRGRFLWSCKDLDMGQKYAASLVVEGQNPNISFRQWE